MTLYRYEIAVDRTAKRCGSRKYHYVIETEYLAKAAGKIGYIEIGCLGPYTLEEAEKFISDMQC